MKELKQKKIKIYLSPEDYDGWNRYCKYHNLTYEKAIKEIVEKWDTSNHMKAQVIQAELNGDINDLPF